MIQLNHPQRQDAKPLTTEQLTQITDGLNYVMRNAAEDAFDLVQRLISSYQNLQHFWDVVGGWEGLEQLKQDCLNEGFTKGIESINH